MQLRKLGSNISFFVSMIFFILSLICYISYKRDILYLRSIVNTQISTETSSKVFESLNHWIYLNGGFKKNHGFFIFKSLGPTPIQVLNHGGDCTDKSILLMTMLDSVGIDSTLVMLFGVDGEFPSHTVVEVRDGKFRAVADPVYDLVFPNTNEGFHNVEDLRKNPAILINRLNHLIHIRGITNKIIFYQRTNESYQFASPINWNKNDLLKLTSNVLRRMGIEPRDIRRPHFLDDPKLFISMAFFCISMFFILLSFVLKKKNRAIVNNFVKSRTKSCSPSST
jgi:hypothetical protein